MGSVHSPAWLYNLTMPVPPRIPPRDSTQLPNAKLCWVCLQLEDEERARATRQMNLLTGHAAWAICPRCSQEAPDREDASYLMRASRFIQSIEN